MVVEVSGGALSSLEKSRKAAGHDLRHPLLWDKDNRNHKNYGIDSWPTAYLIGADGKVFWEGNPAWIRFRDDEVLKLRRLLEDRLEAARSRLEK